MWRILRCTSKDGNCLSVIPVVSIEARRQRLEKRHPKPANRAVSFCPILYRQTEAGVLRAEGKLPKLKFERKVDVSIYFGSKYNGRKHTLRNAFPCRSAASARIGCKLPRIVLLSSSKSGKRLMNMPLIVVCALALFQSNANAHDGKSAQGSGDQAMRQI